MVWFHLYETPRVEKSKKEKSRHVVASAGGRKEPGLPANGQGVAFQVMEVMQHVDVLKPPELETLKG